MAFINQTQYQYYTPGQKFVTNTATANSGQNGTFLLTLDPLPTAPSRFIVFKNGVEVLKGKRAPLDCANSIRDSSRNLVLS